MESTTPPMWSSSIDVAATTKLLTVEKGPCEYCHKVIPLSELIKHEVLLCTNDVVVMIIIPSLL